MEQLDFNQEERTSGLREFLTVIFKQKKVILSIFFLVSIAVTAVTFLTPSLYEAESTILIKIGREYLNRPEVGNTGPVMSLNQQEATNVEMQILNSRDLIEKVISALKLENIYPELLDNPRANSNPMNEAVILFKKKLTVEEAKKSNVIRVSFQHKNPRIAVMALSLLVESFKEKHLQVFSDPKSSFLEMQLATYDQKLKESENNLQNFKQKSGVVALDEQRSLLLRQRNELDTALKNSQNSIYEMQRRMQTLKGQLKTIADSNIRYPNIERDRMITETKAKLLDLQLKEQDLSKKYTENNRLVVNARKEMQTVRNFLKEQEEEMGKVKTGSQIYQNTEMELLKAETELNALKGKVTALHHQIAEVDGQVRSLNLSENGMQELKRQQSINEKNYQTYVEKTEEARITEEMNRLKMVNISVIQKATVPAGPVKQKRLLNIVKGMVIGMLAGLGMAFILELTSMSFSTPEKVENALGLPVLTNIPLIEG